MMVISVVITMANHNSLKIAMVGRICKLVQWRRYRGGRGCLGPPTFYPGGQSRALLLARNLHCKKRINFQAQLIKQTRALPLFSSPRDESSRKRTPHEY